MSHLCSPPPLRLTPELLSKCSTNPEQAGNRVYQLLELIKLSGTLQGSLGLSMDCSLKGAANEISTRSCIPASPPPSRRTPELLSTCTTNPEQAGKQAHHLFGLFKFSGTLQGSVGGYSWTACRFFQLRPWLSLEHAATYMLANQELIY
jgi:hypothetical protein